MQAIWQQRLRRARELAKLSPVEPDILDFYCQMAGLQAAVSEHQPLPNLHLLQALAAHPGGDPMHAFFRRLLRQADCPAATQTDPARCPHCNESPVAVLVSANRRELLCGVCFRRWPHVDAHCLACGADTITLHPDDPHHEFPHIALETCPACGTYLKRIGDGTAVPEVDELASVIVDLWAAAQGFTKLHTNLLGL